MAGAGYINARLDRAASVRVVVDADSARASTGIHALVEHTWINPNKAAHVGHLRNAILGDTFVRLLRAAGQKVDVQNYIDNTGVQVADVVVGFLHLENKSAAEVRALIADCEQRAKVAPPATQQPSTTTAGTSMRTQGVGEGFQEACEVIQKYEKCLSAAQKLGEQNPPVHPAQQRTVDGRRRCKLDGRLREGRNQRRGICRTLRARTHRRDDSNL